MGKLTFTMDTHDWVWLCEMLAEVRAQPDLDDFSKRDIYHILSCLEALEAAA